MSRSPASRAPSRETLERRLAELENLHEIARALLGARDARQAAERVVYAGMGTFGARSGAMFLADERGKFRLAFAHADEEFPAGLPLTIEPEALEWLRKNRVARFAAGGGRALGRARERLTEDFDAAVVVAIGVTAVLALGPRLMEAPYDDEDLAVLESLGGLATLALGSRPAAFEAQAPAAVADAAPAAGTADERAAEPAPAPAAGGSAKLAALRRRHPPLRAIVGESEALIEAFEDVIAVAATRFPVLVHGESGVGKELAARAIHELSERAAGPMEVVDCGSIPRELIESELFGHVKGSFTGAHRDRRGAFELARGGTLFLDEIGEMPLQLQTRLLRVLQEGRFRRVGDESPIEADVRIVAATNRELAREVEAGRFRQDLFYRLNVFSLRLPALRERRGDLARLLAHFLGGNRAWAIAPEAAAALETHAWPGNIRELGNFAAALGVRAATPGRVTLEDLERVWERQYRDAPPWRGGGAAPAGARGQLGAWVLEQARASRFNLVEAARRLAKLKRAGRDVPITERSALSYYVTGEILRALVAADGDAEAAARAIAADDDLTARVGARVEKVLETLRESRSIETARRRFGKLPAGYEDVLEHALELE